MKTDTNARSRRTRILVSLIVVMAAQRVDAQLIDFAITDVSACPLDANNFQVVFSHGITLNGSTLISGTEVTIRVDVMGPSTSAPAEDHKVRIYAPTPDPHKGCKGSSPCSSGTCEDWAAKFKGKLYAAKAACVLTAASGCECVSDDKAPPKEKPKHDGPGNYTITVTIDPENEFPELNEANNSMQFVLQQSASPCLTGACCLTDGSCQPGVTNTACNALDGDYTGNGSVCLGTMCPVKGACCERATNDCLMPIAQSVCEGLGSVYHGDFSTDCPLSASGDCIPTLSEWGVTIMTLLILSAATVVLIRRRASGRLV